MSITYKVNKHYFKQMPKNRIEKSIKKINKIKINSGPELLKKHQRKLAQNKTLLSPYTTVDSVHVYTHISKK